MLFGRFIKTYIIIFMITLPINMVMAQAEDNRLATATMQELTYYPHLKTTDYVRDIAHHPAFKGFAELLLTRDNNQHYYNTPVRDIASLMPYHSHVQPAIVLQAVNHMVDEVNNGNTVFYDIYSEQQKRQDPSKINTGLFFFRGKPNAPFAVVAPGGGFAYVGSLHEGFPLALAISNKGLNAFVVRYRLGSEQKATEDLAAAISFIANNAQQLAVSKQGYSLWGGSAGARMVGNIALSGVAAYGASNLPKPETVIIAYTGQSSYAPSFPPTFLVVSQNDPIANPRVMQRRAENLRHAGVEVVLQIYRTAGHGFGIGVGSDAEGWMDDAVKFWQQQLIKSSVGE